MAVNFFGFEITSKKEREEREQKNLLAFTVPEDQEEAVDVTPIGGYGGGGQYGIAIDIDGSIKDENQLITLYRTMAVYPEVDYAIDDIVNEAIVDADHDFCVSLNTDSVEIGAGVKSKITDEFETILELLDFKLKAYDIFRRWYVDGKVYYHVIIDKTNPKAGIQELRYIDPRKIKKIKERPKKKPEDASKEKVPLAVKDKEYYIYNPKGLDAKNSSPIPITKDAISYNGSGLVDASRKRVISNLQKAVRPWNQLKMLEDAVVIYRISRAPERRVFYVDVGNLPKNKADAYLKDIMVRFKNKVTYNAETGAVEDARYHRTMLEDFWLPRREGGRGTEVSTLSGGQNLGEIEDILYFRRKLYQAMNVPRTRMESDSGFSIGRDTEITRDEVKFGKFVQRLRNRFALLFLDLLEKHLILKNIIAADDWKDIRKNLRFNWEQDTHFMELQQLEMTRGRMEILDTVDAHVGTYISKEWVQKNVLRQTDDEIKEIAAQIRKEEGAGETVVSPAGMGDSPMEPEPPAEEEPPQDSEQPEQIE
jgi:hypothetical protein